MAIYSLELRKLLRDKNFILFDFEYPFYTDNETIKLEFEDKFKNTFFFHEIGFETVMRFKHELKTLLYNKMPHYKQLYETELKSKDINFLLNKDLQETTERDLIGSASSNTVSNNQNTATSKNTTESKESNIAGGLSHVDINKSVTAQSQETSNNNDTLNSNTNTENNNESNTKEITKLSSQGNIGTTSSAKLLQEWREVLQNLDEIILSDCKDLFMLIY